MLRLLFMSFMFIYFIPTYSQSGNVGIGTNTPSSKLEVNGNASINSLTGDTELLINSPGTSTSSLKIFEAGAFGFQFEYDGASNVDKFYLRSRGFCCGNDAIRMTWLKNGKVGIGTTSPDQDFSIFDVDGNGGAALNIKDINRELFLGVTSSGASLRSITNDDLSFWTNSSRKMTIGNDGKIGMGTSSPDANLEISGTGETTLRLTSETFNNPKIEFIGPSNWSIENVGGFIFYRNILDQNPINEFNFIKDNFYPKQGETTVLGATFSRWKEGYFADFLDVSKSGVSGRLSTNSNSISVGSTTSHNLELLTNNQSRITINTDGKVGIGTQNPDRKLTIFNADGSSLNIKDNNRELFLGVNSSDATLRTLTNHNLSFWTNDDRKMTIDTDGHVGIGTDAPEFPLHIQNPGSSGQTISMVLESANSQRPVLLFSEVASNHTFSSGMSIEYDGTGTGDDNRLRFNNSDGDPAMVVENGGDVGINTEDPQMALHIVKKDLDDLFFIRLDNDPALKFWDLEFNSGNDLQFRFTNSIKARIRATNGAYIQVSDRKLKKEILPMGTVLEKLKDLRPVTYQFKDQDNDERSLGFIAQEVEEVFPEIVSESDGFKTLNYDAFGVLAIQAIKEQQMMINDLQKENELLKEEIEILSSLENELYNLKKQLSEIQKTHFADDNTGKE